MYNRSSLNVMLSQCICGTFPGVGLGVGEINNKDHLSPAEAERWAELGKICMTISFPNDKKCSGIQQKKK